jgi:hypothetical protein
MERLLPGAIGVGLIAVGGAAVVAPVPSAAMFGLPAADRTAQAYVRATGARDVILGAIVLTSLGDRRALRRILGLTSLIALGDAVTLATMRGPQLQHVGHLGGLALLALAALTTRP